MRVLLFLGSGVSLQSGLPGVEELTRRLLEPPHTRSPDRVFRLLALLRAIDQHYLQSIAPFWSGDQYRYTGAIYRQATTYEDLFYLAGQIALSGSGLLDDATAGALVDLVEARAGVLLTGDSRPARLNDLSRLANQAKARIETIVSESLRSTRIEGLDLVIELARSRELERLDIVTLNHDTLVERVLEAHGIPFVDGFGPPDGDVRWFDSTTYDAKARVYLIKPHGSIDWYAFDVSGSPRMSVVRTGRPTESTNRDGEPLFCQGSTPSFLSGTNKVVGYNRGIFAEMLYRLHQALHQNDRLVMSGYGWGDTAINFRLDSWLDPDRGNQMILLHRDPEGLTQRSLLLDAAYRAWVTAGRLVPVRRWLSESFLSDLRPHLQT